MYYHQITEEQWPTLKPYLDTCIIPVAAVRAGLEIWQIKSKHDAMEEAKNWIERSFSGRVIIYPDVSYVESADRFTSYIDEVIYAIYDKGFRYIVLMCNESLVSVELERVAVIRISNEGISEEDEKSIRQTIIELWESGKGQET